MTYAVKFLFFISSFSPVYAMIAALAWDTNNPLALFCVGATIGSIILYRIFEGAYSSSPQNPLRVHSVRPKSENVFMYIIAYLPPFFSIDYTERGDLVALALFYLMFFIIYVRLGMYYLNPIFVVRGLRAFEVVNDGGEQFTALAHSSLRLYPGIRVRYRNVGEFIIIDSDFDDDELGDGVGGNERRNHNRKSVKSERRRKSEKSALQP